MPIYVFFNPHTGVEWEELMSLSKREKFLDSHPHVQQIITAPNIVGGTGDRVKPDEGMKEVLSKIGSKFPNSPVDKRYNKVGAKDQKTRDVIKKHIDIQNKK